MYVLSVRPDGRLTLDIGKSVALRGVTKNYRTRSKDHCHEAGQRTNVRSQGLQVLPVRNAYADEPHKPDHPTHLCCIFIIYFLNYIFLVCPSSSVDRQYCQLDRSEWYFSSDTQAILVDWLFAWLVNLWNICHWSHMFQTLNRLKRTE